VRDRLRRVSMWSMPGSLKSSDVFPLPRMKRASSTPATTQPQICHVESRITVLPSNPRAVRRLTRI